MPQTKQAIKDLRQTKKRTAQNTVVKENLEYLFRNFKKAIKTADKKKSEELSKKLIKSIDKAAQKNILKKTTAARKKSRMMSKVNNLK